MLSSVIASIIVLGLTAMAASGMILKHTRLLTWLGSAGVLFEGMWLGLTWLDREVFVQVSTERVFLWSSLLLLGVCLLGIRRFRLPYQISVNSGKRDTVVIVVLVLVAAASLLIFRFNHFVGLTWVTHGFFNGDTMTLATLVNRSMLTDRLVHENPWAANGQLEYPTLLHAGLATFFAGISLGDDWLAYLPALTLVQIVLTVPLLFLVWDVFSPEPKESWKLWFGLRSRWVIRILQGLLALYVLALAWDGYIYPQSHFFLTGLFLLFGALLVSAYSQRGLFQNVTVVPAFAIALILLAANAVTGTAAIGTVLMFSFLRMTDRTRVIPERTVFMLAAVIYLGLFWLLPPGEGAFGKPSFSYTAALDMLRLGLPAAALLASVWLQLGRQQFMSLAAAGLSVLGIITFFFSGREIVVENASRFFYHGILLGFPLLMSPLLRLGYWLRRELIFSARPIGQLLAGWGAAGVAAMLFLLPALSSVASAHDHLMFQDERKVSLAQQTALDWIRDHTKPENIFLTSPSAPWIIPYFTGRSLTRADYWLSPDDIFLAEITAAFQGSKAAQEAVVTQADYLVLREGEQNTWGELVYPIVFQNPAITIYQLRM